MWVSSGGGGTLQDEYPKLEMKTLGLGEGQDSKVQCLSDTDLASWNMLKISGLPLKCK